MDTKSKSTAGKQVIGFLCFVMSFSIFFSVGLLLLEQPVYGSNSINFVSVSYTHLTLPTT